ncbi:hypothetical protein MTO96_047822 [Rhipicephalus appendiculatus]
MCAISLAGQRTTVESRGSTLASARDNLGTQHADAWLRKTMALSAKRAFTPGPRHRGTALRSSSAQRGNGARNCLNWFPIWRLRKRLGHECVSGTTAAVDGVWVTRLEGARRELSGDAP